MNKLVPKILLAITTIVVVLVILEVVLRVSKIDENGFQLVNMKREYFLVTKTNTEWVTTFVPNVDTKLDYTGREKQPVIIQFTTVPIPGFPQYGMRDDGINTTATTFIPVLGDSFTWGATVNREDIWAEIIEEKNEHLDMINLGQTAGVLQSATMYEAIKKSLPPHETVIYAMWLGNEFLDNYAFAQVDLSTIQPTENNQAKERWFYPVITKSRLAYLGYKLYALTNQPLKQVIRYGSLRPAAGQITDYLPETEEGFNEYGSFDLEPNNQIALRYAEVGNSDPIYLSGKEATYLGMKKLKESTERGNITPVIILLPFKEQVYYDLIKEEIAFEVDIRQPNKDILMWCQELEITCIDILDDLMQEKEAKLFWDYDRHFTPEGQRKAAESIERRLKEAALI